MAEHSVGFKEFLVSLKAPKDDRQFGDDFAIGGFAMFSDEERSEAESLLLDRFAADPGDSRIAPALAELGSERAIQPIRRVLPALRGTARVRAATALAQLESSFDPFPYLVSAFDEDDRLARALAAAALGSLGDDRSQNVLLGALDDDDANFRAQAFHALGNSLGLSRLRQPRYSPLREIAHLLTSQLEPLRNEAVQRARLVVGALRGGHSPEGLGLDRKSATLDALDQILAMVRSPTATEPTERDAAKLDDRGRELLESMLLSELPSDNPRIPRLLGRIGTDRAIAVLEQAQWMALARSRDEIVKALKALGKSD